MSRFTAIDLSGLAPPDIIETLEYEAIVAEMRDDLVARFPLIAGVIDLESEPARKLIEAFAYRELRLRSRINDGARAVVLASSWGSNLDHLGALFGTARQEGETDDRLRRRVQLAPEAFSVAGPEGAYQYHVLTVAPWARDVSAIMTQPGVIRVTVLRAGPDPTPSEAERETIRLHLQDDAIRPLTDVVQVLPPVLRPLTIEARLTLYPGPDAGIVRDRATTALSEWVEQNRMLGMNLRRSAIYARLHQEGVHSVDLISPTEDVVLDVTQVYAVDAIDITTASTRDE
ncbi:baseplate assembly protein [Bauldia litoralis]|uniref:Phage-related baseplate assembly protein n=1 Tax=Bauldia litoralis TaxID=665467 RepID=A0A1G6EJC2_9HYPH|nr:baseplate J/gp47 family protein [Bauldia litoralis]SDB57573.1 Phage-related baseplate assembly protein [Bauldia litoralis]